MRVLPVPTTIIRQYFTALVAAALFPSGSSLANRDLRVGAAAVNLEATDEMTIGGSILGRNSVGQDGELRAVAVVVKGPQGNKIALVACDVLMMKRDLLDPVAEEISRTCGIPLENILINCTHTHHAPTTCTVHGYSRDEDFCQQVQLAVVEAVRLADKQIENAEPVRMHFRLGQEATVGQNSRVLLSDGTITWSGSRDDMIRPTGPFDPDLPVIAFQRDDDALVALIYNHSTHTIGTLSPQARSPAFYGLAAQQLESERGGTVLFLEGASGSTHRWDVTPEEAVIRMKNAVTEALGKAVAMPVDAIAAVKREITVRVRRFDETEEDEAVTSYTIKRLGKARAEPVIDVFRKMRRELAPQQDAPRRTWIHAIRIGEVAIVGVPAEFFTTLGIEIKRRSPFRHTIIAELANDWIGYVPDDDAYDLGGYQVWTGLHSWVARGTGERIVDEAIEMLEELWPGD